MINTAILKPGIYALEKGMFDRLICNAYTIRGEKYRIISSRTANKKLTLLYGSGSK